MDKQIESHIRAHPVCRTIPGGFRLADVEIHLAKSAERHLWDTLMDRHHYLGFRQFAARGMRYVATWKGRWLALAGWQGGAFKCGPRDRWIGWRPEQQFKRLDLIANNTRFLVLADPGALPNLASFFLAGMTRRLSGDWLSVHGHGIVMTETFCDPELYSGAMYRASGWHDLGATRGFSRVNSKYTDPHGKPKRILVRPLRRDARRFLARPDPLPPDVVPPANPDLVPHDPATMRSLHTELAGIQDWRRAQGCKHSLAGTLTVIVLATLANMKGCSAAARFGKSLSQEELAAIRVRRNKRTGLFEPPAKSTIHRAMEAVDPEILENVLRRCLGHRIQIARALATDGKRIQAASRNGMGHHKTVALIDHATGAPVEIPGHHDGGGGGGGDLAAMHDLLKRSDIRGKVITLEGQYTVRDTARLITERRGADYVFTVKDNAPKTHAALGGIDWERERDGHYAEDATKAHGGTGQWRIDVLSPRAGTINYPGIRQVARVRRWRESVLPADAGKSGHGTAYLITSLNAEAASPRDLLDLSRGHWAVENLNHRVQDTIPDGNACRNDSTNRASLNMIALAVVFADRREGEGITEAMRHRGPPDGT